MTLACVVLLLFSVSIAAGESGLLPQTSSTNVRICGLPEDATNFTCNSQLYLQSVYSRTNAVIVLSALFLLVTTVIVLLPCMARLECCSCIGTDPMHGETRFGNCRQSIWFMVAFLFLLLGCGCGIYSSVRSTDILNTTTTTLEFKSLQLLQVGERIEDKLKNTTLDEPQLEDTMEKKLNEVFRALELFSKEIKKASPMKDVYTTISTVWIVLLGAISLLYVATGHRFLFHLIGFMAFWTVLGVCVFMVGMTLLSVVFHDVCHEYDHSPNVFDLLQNQLDHDYASLYTSLEERREHLVVETCNHLSDYCPSQPDLCKDDCNDTTFASLPSRHVIDWDDVVTPNKTVDECSRMCVDDGLRNMSRAVVGSVALEELARDVTGMVRALMMGFLGPEVRGVVKTVSCEATKVMEPLWAAFALVIFGVIFQNIALLALDRSLCCFKYERYNSDEYQELKQI